MDINSLIIPFISGVAGFAGGIIATYVKWDIEKKKIKVENRKERVDKWRTTIEEAESTNALWGSSAISDLKEYLTEKEAQTLHSLIATIGVGGSGDDIKKGMLFKVITRVEKSWDLI
ncbi:MAG: hypothetical protein N0E54_03010 [Candidatus Thiodiazotropha taylori]|nr:hypothetical protein [Candidatus Thiodiazotropha endolucinida]MCW4227696.1 hypothetical protein [Candidatus Thiodiazotropha taylori]